MSCAHKRHPSGLLKRSVPGTLQPSAAERALHPRWPRPSPLRRQLEVYTLGSALPAPPPRASAAGQGNASSGAQTPSLHSLRQPRLAGHTWNLAWSLIKLILRSLLPIVLS